MIRGLFTNAKKLLLESAINLGTDIVKVGILKSTYTLNIAHENWSDVSANEIAVSGDYTAGGMALQNPAFSVDNEEGVVDFSDVVIASFNVPDMQYLILYKTSGNPATSPLIGYINLETLVSYTDKNVRIAWNALGVLRLL